MQNDTQYIQLMKRNTKKTTENLNVRIRNVNCATCCFCNGSKQ